MPKLETCIALKKAGFPQEIKGDDAWFYVKDHGWRDKKFTMQRICAGAKWYEHHEYAKIPTLEELLVWGAKRIGKRRDNHITITLFRSGSGHCLIIRGYYGQDTAVEIGIKITISGDITEALANTILAALGRVK